MELVWHLWGEIQEARLEELREYINNFPEGLIADSIRKEILYLEDLKKRMDS